MEYLTAMLGAIWLVGLPLFTLAFALVWWALFRGRVEGDSFEDLQQSMADLVSRQKDKEQAERMDPALGKWFSFGGGFYGLVALYTWLLIEWDEVVALFSRVDELVLRFDLGILISFFIQSLMNFIWAIAWPIYWLGRADNPWIWLLVAYGGYWLGMRAAQRVAGHRWR